MSTYDNQKLKAIIKLLKENQLKVKVGIMAESAPRSDRLNNPTIGLFHEYGTSQMKQRSFLRMPLSMKMQEAVNSTKGLLNKPTFQKIYEQRSLSPLLTKLGKIGKTVILKAFDTGGFGQWASLKPRTVRSKKNLQILVETQQLRNSISY